MTTLDLLLRRRTPDEVTRMPRRRAVDAATLVEASRIVEEVRMGGSEAVSRFAERFGESREGENIVLGPEVLQEALDLIDPETRRLLERTASRIALFARAQRDAIAAVDVEVPGGRAGHTIEPIANAGCYAPAGRYPLPSSVLMTGVTARVAGCQRVVVASPSREPIMLAAAAIAGAEQYLAVGGAHAVAAMAFGMEGFEACDVIVGPGNKWVTAAKQLVSDAAGIDMLAGPSELLVIADHTADVHMLAADLLAQAEHDPDASSMLITTCEAHAEAINEELHRQLPSLSTSQTASAALANGFVCVASSITEALQLADRIAAEHVQIMTEDPAGVAARLRNGGGVFIGPASAEVLGDYGAGPNHTLPTGGTARFRAGLSVSTFLRLRTWLRIDDPAAAEPLIEDTAALAAIEGLDAHKAAAQRRLLNAPSVANTR